MQHEGYREMLELAALGVLGGEELRALAAHLWTCAACRAELRELHDAAAMLMLYAGGALSRIERPHPERLPRDAEGRADGGS